MDGGTIAALIVVGGLALVILADTLSRAARSERAATTARNEMWATYYEEQTL